MNVLLFVMTMLMLFSLLTYGRLESFRNFVGMQSEFSRYMQEYERKWVNEQAEELYDRTKASQRGKSDQDKEKGTEGVSKISIQLFVNQQQRDKNAQVFDQYRLLLKNLMRYLYADKTFYKEVENERPDFLDTLIDKIILLSGEKKYTKPKELATMDFQDQKLNETFYKMLKGSPMQEEDLTAGYPSLLNFLTDKPKFRIRVYLAPRAILAAIFGEATSYEIMHERKRYYSDVSGESMSSEDATTAFQQQFGARGLPGIEDTLLDFKVTKTRPSSS